MEYVEIESDPVVATNVFDMLALRLTSKRKIAVSNEKGRVYGMGKLGGEFFNAKLEDDDEVGEPAVKIISAVPLHIGSKASIVRNMIGDAKLSSGTQEDVILRVMNELQFNRSLARVYVVNNWDKVVTS